VPDPIAIDHDIAISPLTKDDAEEYAALVTSNRERLARWLPYYARLTSPARFHRYLESVRNATKRRLWVDFAIRVDGELSGSIAIHHIDPLNAVGDVGYWIGSRFTRRKIMSRVLPVAADIAYRDFAVHRLQLITDVNNIASRIVAERAGFHHETTLRERFVSPIGYSDGAMYVRFFSTTR
jgi:ribosomal-protein-serine acetyltransferase